MHVIRSTEDLNEFGQFDPVFDVDESWKVYTALKERIQDQITQAKSLAEVARLLKIQLYIEHRAEREAWAFV